MGSRLEWVIGPGESRLGVQPEGHGVDVWFQIARGVFVAGELRSKAMTT